MSDKKLYQLNLGGNVQLPAWTLPVASGDYAFDDVSLCEQGDDTCTTPMYWTGIEDDTSILLCATHVLADMTPVTEIQYAALIERQKDF
jgi:hypothetical protein